MLQQEIAKFQGQFVIVIENGVVVEIGNTFMLHPEIKFAGSGIQWLEEEIKKE